MQILPRNITLTQGTEVLACIRLTPQGLLRWYAGCCNTPIGNTLATPRISFIGLVHNCLENPDRPLDEAFGPVRAWLHTKSAQGEPKPRLAGLGTSIAWFMTNTLKARFNGGYKITPFFHSDTGAPVASPRVLSIDEHAGVMSAVRAAAR